MAAVAVGVVAAIAGGAFADQISNTLDTSVDAVAETMPLTAGGATGTTHLYIVPENNDGKNGCNLTGSTTATISLASSNTSVATVSPSSVTFTSCVTSTTGPVVTVTPVAQGTADITATLTSNTTAGTFDVAPVKFTVNVGAATPANTPPYVSISGVTGGASYDKGSVPAATCNVTDTEDGNSSFAATLSAITGSYASDGIGSQTASCSYTDGGGLTATDSVTYNIIDPSAPNIGYTLNPASADGANGWYTSNVTLTWNVSEPQSPNSLVKTGCVDQNITADQAEQTYSCSARSAGGSATQVDVKIKRDATAPTGSCNSAPTAWSATDVLVGCTASDALSLLADSGDASFNLTTNVAAGTETSNASTDSHDVFDNAGNKQTFGPVTGIKVDRKAPTISDDGTTQPATGNDGTNDWYNHDVTVTFSATDLGSGRAAACPASWTANTSGEGAVTASSGACADMVGNNNAGITSRGYNVDKTKPTVSVTGFSDGAVFYAGDTLPTVGCSRSDDRSGIDSSGSTGPTVTAGGLDANGVGSVTYTCAAKDNAGNTSSASATYSVNYHFNGFFQPINNPDSAQPCNSVKAGQAIPVKFSLGGYHGLGVFAAGFPTVSASTSCSAAATDPVETTLTAGNSSLSYDSTTDTYTYVWKTDKSWAGSAKRLTVKFDDGTSYYARFVFTK